MGIKSPRLNLVPLPTFQQWKKPTPFKYSNLLINLTFHMYAKHPIKLLLLFILLTEMPFFFCSFNLPRFMPVGSPILALFVAKDLLWAAKRPT